MALMQLKCTLLFQPVSFLFHYMTTASERSPNCSTIPWVSPYSVTWKPFVKDFEKFFINSNITIQYISHLVLPIYLRLIWSNLLGKTRFKRPEFYGAIASIGHRLLKSVKSLWASFCSLTLAIYSWLCWTSDDVWIDRTRNLLPQGVRVWAACCAFSCAILE